MAENENAYMGAWEPIRVAEGFNYDEYTISAMPAVSWQPRVILAEMATADGIVELLAEQGRVKFDSSSSTWGMENLVLLTPTAFDAIRKEQRSRADIQKALYKAIQLPCYKFFRGKEPSSEVGATLIPERLVEKCREDSEALVPLLLKPESVKIVVAGAPGPPYCVYIATWGFGPAHFITKAIRLPQIWENLLDKYKGWETPVVK
jgi:hypothetical protein